MIESTYTQGINKAVRLQGVYAWKISDKFARGVPDAYYSDQTDLWIEFKYVQKFPVRAPVTPKLTEDQKDWLTEQAHRGRTVAVIVGSPTGAIIYPGITWQTPVPAASPASKKEVAEWIINQVRT